jgi:plastocyanin domain-containing protein
VLRVEPAPPPAPRPKTTIPPDAVRIQISERGYDPAKIEIPANRPLTLAFTRDATPNCGSEVVFPSLGIRKQLPVGETVLVELPAQPAGELAFGCGMGMYRGMIVVR